MNLPKQSGTGMMQSVVSIYPVAVLIWGKYSNREMNIRRFFLLLCNLVGYALGLPAQQTAVNPLIYADVPDMSMVRVDDTYYMSSTTMHMVPGVPIMKSKDLVNWELVSYAYDTLADDVPAMNLDDGRIPTDVARGQAASAITKGCIMFPLLHKPPVRLIFS